MNTGRELFRGKLWINERQIFDLKKKRIEIIVFSATHNGQLPGQLHIYKEKIHKSPKVVFFADIKEIQNDHRPGNNAASLDTGTFWRFTLITKVKTLEFFADTQKDQLQWMNRLKVLINSPDYPIPEELTENPIKKFNLRLIRSITDDNADSVWVVYILPEYLGSKINILGTHILTFKSAALSNALQPGHLSIFNFADPVNPIVTWKRDKIQLFGHYNNIEFVGIGQEGEGGPGLVWMYVGAEEAVSFRETINTFVKGGKVFMSTQQQISPDTTYAAARRFRSIPLSFKNENEMRTTSDYHSVQKSSNRESGYSSIDPYVVIDRSPSLQIEFNSRLPYLQEEQDYDKSEDETGSWWEAEINEEKSKPIKSKQLSLDSCSISLITKEASTIPTVSVIGEQPISPLKLVNKRKKEINTSIDDIMLPASLFLRHKDDCNFCMLISKQIEELYDVPQNLYQTPAISSESLCGVHIAGKKRFFVQRNGHKMNWDQYGLRITLCEVELLPSTDTAEISVVALVGGQFKFPKNSKLVSAVYAVSVSESIVHSQLRLEMQHCVYLTSEDQIQYLKFAIAPINATSLPYVFKIVEEGQFAVGNWYGSITRNKYCLVCIVGINGDQLESENEEENEEEEKEEEEGPPPPPSPSSCERQDHDPSKAGGIIQPQSEGVGLEKPLPKKSQQEESTTFIQSILLSSVNSSTVTRQMKTERNEAATHSRFHSTKTPESSTDSCIGLEKLMTYAGLVFYEEEGKEDLVTFTAAKHLNALLQFIEKKHCHAKIRQNEYFRLKNPNGFIELKFDAPQDQPYNGWTISPHKKPVRLKQSDIDLFGDDYPIPAACLISVYGSPDAVASLHYGVPLEGVANPVTLYIHTQLRTAIESIASVGSPLEERSLTNNDAGTNSSEIFRKYYFMLIDKLEKHNIVDRAVDHFFSISLIGEATHSDVTSSNDIPYKKGGKIVKELYNLLKTSQNSRTILSSICKALNEHDQLKDIGQKIEQDMTII